MSSWLAPSRLIRLASIKNLFLSGIHAGSNDTTLAKASASCSSSLIVICTCGKNSLFASIVDDPRAEWTFRRRS